MRREFAYAFGVVLALAPAVLAQNPNAPSFGVPTAILQPPVQPGPTKQVTPPDPKKKEDPKLPAPPTPAPTTPPSNETPSEGRYKSSFGMGTAVSAGGGGGASVAAASAGLPATPNGAFGSPSHNARTATVTTDSTPLILPGLFTAASVQNAIPVDRVWFDYGYYNRFAVTSPTGPTPGFNLNQFNVGVEKTFLDGRASIYVSVPFLNATDNVTAQDINGLGDVNVGFKFMLYQNKDTGSAFTTGFTVAAPTAHSTNFTTTSNLNLTFTGPAQPGLPVGANIPVTPATTSTSVNPTYLQPWIGGMYVKDRFFVHEYFGVLIPTDDRISTIINNDLTFGYTIYNRPEGFLRSITPTIGAQMLLPVNYVNNSGNSSTTSQVATDINCLTSAYPVGQLPTSPSHFTFPDQVFLTGGAQFGLGERCMFSAGVVVPVVAPRGYTVGATAGLTFFY